MVSFGHVTEPTFAQPARRNLLAPVLIALFILGVAIALIVRYTPHTVAEVNVVHAVAYPTHTVFKSDTILVGRDRSQDDLYALVTVSITDRLNLPIFLKDFSGSLTTAEGDQVAATAAHQNDLENIYTSFPGLRPLSSDPLRRDTLLNPGSSAEGMVLLHFPVSAETWNHRRSATLNIDLYHQGSLAIAIPQDVMAASTNGKSTSEQ